VLISTVSPAVAEASFFRISAGPIYRGANPFSADPVLLVDVWLEAAAWPGAEILQSRLNTHWGPILGRAFEPLAQPVSSGSEEPAADVGQLVVNLAKAFLNARRGCIGVVGVATVSPDRLLLWCGFHEPALTRSALALALQAVVQVGRDPSDKPPSVLLSKVQELLTQCLKQHPDYQARILIRAAQARGVPALRLSNSMKLWQFGWGQRSELFMESSSNADGMLGAHIQGNKSLSKQMFIAMGLPTPVSVLVNHASELEAAVGQIGWPCVVKPLDSGGGKGVMPGIRKLPELQAAFAAARQISRGPIMLEAFVPGDDYRLMVLRGKLVAAVRRDPPVVLGDGRRSVRALLVELNDGRSANLVASAYRRVVPHDAMLTQQLVHQGLDLDSVPAPGQCVKLRSNANLSTGGSCTDVTAALHPLLRQMAEVLADSMGLKNTGIDYITTDISAAPAAGIGALIEVNCTPGLDALVAAGWMEERVGDLCLGLLPGRIPVVLVLVARLRLDELQSLLRVCGQSDAAFGWVCGEAAALGCLPLQVAALASFQRPAVLLRLRTLERLLLVCCVEDFEQSGGPVDRVDAIVACHTKLSASASVTAGRMTTQQLSASTPAEAIRLSLAVLEAAKVQASQPNGAMP
jgi:cyanophycin synthetase